MPAITVTLVDAITDQPVYSEAIVIARSGLFYADTSKGTSGFHAFAHERPGVYSVSVDASGYKPWSLPQVTVNHDVCHVIMVPLAARLYPTTP